MEGKLRRYIETRRKEGLADSDIKLELISLGFPKDEAAKAFLELEKDYSQEGRQNIIGTLALLAAIIILVIGYSLLKYYFIKPQI